MKTITAIFGIITLASGILFANSERLFPPLITAIFGISAAFTIVGLLAINRKYGR